MNESRRSPLSVLEAPICCSVDPTPSSTTFHCAISVADLARSVEFYRILFGVRPAKQHADYAKFELTRPPLIFSLIPHLPGLGCTLRYFAFPVHHPAEVEALATRLSTAGLAIDEQRHVIFDDARQSVAELSDPDGNLWRIVCRLSDREPIDQQPSSSNTIKPAIMPPGRSQIGWEHRIIAPCPDRIPHADGSVDLIRLEGTFNADLTGSQRHSLLAEANRVLKPGGLVSVHGLVSNRVLRTCPVLHGVAALVRRVPTDVEVLSELSDAGFTDIYCTKFPAKPVFHWNDIELRELKLSAQKPTVTTGDLQTVVYRGPFAGFVTDAGQTFVRGIPTPVDATTHAIFQSEPWKGQFLSITAETDDDVRRCANGAAPPDSTMETGV